MLYGQNIFDKGPKTHNVEKKKASSINGAGKIGKPRAKEWKQTTIFPMYRN